MVIYFAFHKGNDYFFSREKPKEKKYQVVEIEVTREKLPQLYSFTKEGGDQGYDIISASTNIETISNIVSAIKKFPEYHFNMIQEALESAGIEV